MISTVLVPFIALHGPALFYDVLIWSKNVLPILAMCLEVTGIVPILWWAVGYSFTFSGANPLIGDLSNVLFEE